MFYGPGWSGQHDLLIALAAFVLLIWAVSRKK